ncbi:MAG: hypothetical protein JRS35_25415, partial [Deltaproteobacteria bacterium]|nr:hypothetical protein [Deltaproteobacteria bacterium]
MSKISVAALALAVAALGFALGYTMGPAHDYETTALVRHEGAPAPAPGSVSAAVEAALTNPDPLERTAQLARLLDGLGPESVGEVKAAFDAFWVDSGDLAIVLFAEWWARLDPRSAFDWASSEWTARHPAVLMSVVYAWARRDPEEA